MAKRKTYPDFAFILCNCPAQQGTGQNSSHIKKSMRDWLTGRKIPFLVNTFTTNSYEIIKIHTPHFK
jgi:hypothetical protein